MYSLANLNMKIHLCTVCYHFVAFDLFNFYLDKIVYNFIVGHLPYKKKIVVGSYTR